MLLQRKPALALLSFVQPHGVQGQRPAVSNDTQTLTGFEPCDTLISSNLSHAVHLASSPLYPDLVEGSWTKVTQRTPYCFFLPTTTDEVSRAIGALSSAEQGAGDWHIAIRSGGHGYDMQNSVTDGLIIDMSYMNATNYDATTNVVSIGTGAKWGEVYTQVQEHGVSVTGGRQSPVGVGGLTLGGGVGWTTPRTGFGCDSVVNYEIVLASGEIVNANASCHADLWRALKGGGSNYGLVTRFDIDAFPASNITIERRTIGPNYTDEYIDAVVDFADLDRSFNANAMVSVISSTPAAGTVMTVTEVNTKNEFNSSAWDKFDRMPVLVTTGKKSLALPDVAAIDAPELSKSKEAINVGAGAVTIANDRRIVRFLFDQHEELITELKVRFGTNFTTMIELQPLNKYYAEISAEKGGNMLGLERSSRSKLYFALAVTLTSSESAKQQPQVFQSLSARLQKIQAYAKTIGADEDFIYLPYAKAVQDPLGTYGAENVRFMKEVSKRYDPERFFQRMVPGGFKIDRVNE